MVRGLLVFGGSLLLAVTAFAQSDTSKLIGLDQRFGAKTPTNAVFRDENGSFVTLGSLYGKRPIVVLPMFFGCNGVCRLEVEGLFKMLEKNPSTQLGRDFDLVLMSINHKETPDLAREKERRVLAAYKVEGASQGSHSWVGEEEEIRKVTDSVGFRFVYDENTGRINHPAGLVFLDKEGFVRGYMYGNDYPSEVFNANLAAASKGEKGLEPEVILLGCIMIDPVTGKRTVVIKNVAAVLGIATALILAGSIFYMNAKYKPGSVQ